DALITREPSAPDREVYINHEWRFSFEYPEGWEPQIPLFGGPVVFFSMGLWNLDKDIPITISAYQKEWFQEQLVEKETNGKPADKIVVGDEQAFEFKGGGWMGRPSLFSIILVNDQYWITITGLNGYESERELVRSTFRFHEPLPTLEELGIEPYEPE
ncbi:hypothetical protein GVX82_04810, partial [Patescibacteria group bacterium]|nr:hypothetical protein [Patescibacteria group bacterium]